MSENSKNVSYLKQAHLFSDLTDEELEAIADRVLLREFQKGQVILFEEDTNKYMYSVLEGEVKVYNTAEDGKDSIVAFHGAGESFGEVSLIDQQTTPAMVAAVEKSLLLIIGRADFFDIVLHQPKAMNTLLLMLTGRLRHSWSQIRLLHFKDAANRIMASIKVMADERGEECADGVLLKLRLTHQNIADMTGLTRETVTRVVDKWKKSGLISHDGNKHLLLSKKFFKENINL